MDASRPVFRITIKELILEIEDERSVQQIGASLGALLGQAEGVRLASGEGPKRRGRPPKAAASVAKPAAHSRKRRSRADSATALIRELRDEGYFAEPRRAGEVKSMLTGMGHELENRQIYATLKYMVDKGILYRANDGDEGVWLYSAAPVP